MIGSGISGLSAAHYLSDQPRTEVTVLEASSSLGGRANTTVDGEHCTRVFLDDYLYLNDLLRDVPSPEGGSVLDSLERISRFARTRDGRWIEIDHIYAFLSRRSGLSPRDKVAILRSNRKALLAAIDAGRQIRPDETPGRGRWTLRGPQAAPGVPARSSNVYGSVWNWTPAGLARALRSSGSSANASVLPGSTDRWLIDPWVALLRARGVTVRADNPVDAIEVRDDGVDVRSGRAVTRYDHVVVAAFARDAFDLLDRSGVARVLDPRTHAHFKVLTIGLHPDEPALQDPRCRIFSSAGIATVVQPDAARCVCMATYPVSTEAGHVLGVVREQLSLKFEPLWYQERDNLGPGEAVFVGDYVDPVALMGNSDRVHFAGSCMDNSYPVDSGEGACRAAFNAVARIAHHLPKVSMRPAPRGAPAPQRARLFRFTTATRAHPNAPASAALNQRLWKGYSAVARILTASVATVSVEEDRGVGLAADGPVIYVATHRSLFDAPLGMVVFHRLGAQPRLVVASKYFNHPLGSFLRGVGAMAAVRRSDATINAAVAALEAGESVAFMIEGRVTDHREAVSARHGRGAVEAALRTGRPIVPIAAAGSHEVWPIDAPRPRLRWGRRPVNVTVGSAITATGTRQELAATVRAELTAVESLARGEIPSPSTASQRSRSRKGTERGIRPAPIVARAGRMAERPGRSGAVPDSATMRSTSRPSPG